MKSSDVNEDSRLSLRANVSWMVVGNVVHAASWFAMTIVLAKLGSPAHVGQFAFGLATTAPIFMFASLRLREVQATDIKDEYLFQDYFALRLISMSVAMLLVVGIAAIYGFQEEIALVILAVAFSKAIEAISDGFYGLFMKHERLDRIAKSMMMKGPLALVGLTLGFYLTGSVFWGVVGLAIARFSILLTYDFRNAALTLKPSMKLILNCIPRDLPLARWDREILARLIRLTIPLGLVNMLGSFTTNVPRYVIEAYWGEYQLGIFAAIASFKKVALTVVQALGRSATPRLAKYYAVVNAAAFRKLTIRLLFLTILLGAAGVLVALVAGGLILTLLYGPEYALPRLFALIMFVAGIEYAAAMLLAVITSARYFRVQLPLQLVTTGVVTLCCFWLVPSVGLTGAAVALLVGHLVRVAGTMIVAKYAQQALA